MTFFVRWRNAVMRARPLVARFDCFFGTSGCSTAQPPFGFIENDRFPSPPSYYNPIFPNTGRPGMTSPGWDHKAADPTFTRKAVDYIEARRSFEKPLFLYFSLSAPHEPCVTGVVPEFARGRSEAGPRGDLVWLVDWMVGELVAALERTGRLDNTLLIVTSDNGALPGDRVLQASGKTVFHTSGHASCGTWRGHKHEIWEGGHREAAHCLLTPTRPSAALPWTPPGRAARR